jgi:hypothetical protein
VSDRPSRGATAERDAGAAAIEGVTVLPSGYRTGFTKVNRARFVSLGHASGRWEVDVYANEPAGKALAAHAREAPVGAMMVEEHYERREGHPTGPIMLMEKREKGYAPDRGDWRYVVVGANGKVVSDGPAPSCAGCHDDAPSDGLFPIVD